MSASPAPEPDGARARPTRATDALIRALGADPAVYHPVLRAQSRILSRRTRLARGAGRVITKGITPFQFRCFMMAVFSLVMLQWIVGATSPIFGVALVLTAGASFLLLDLLFDKFDLLADADEYQVIAAHPHDAWSVILAKIVALGRSTAALTACLFLIPAIGAGFAFHGVGAGAAFALAAVALSFVVSAGGMLASALIVATGGRQALLRLLPLAHVTYLAFYLGVIALRGVLVRLSVPRLESLGWIQWALPSVWFAAPVEVASGDASAAAIGRGALAAGSVAVLLPLSAQWVRTRFDERILEPVRRRRRSVAKTTARSARVAVRGSRALSDRAVGSRVFWRLAAAHFRSDTAVRSGMLMAFFMPVVMMGGQVFTMRRSLTSGADATLILTWLIVAETFLTRSMLMSSRPAAIWFVLTAPRARVPFSRALETAVRLGVILPGVLGTAIYTALAWREPVWVRAAFVILVAIIADSVLLMLRVMNPFLPFSQVVRAKRPISWPAILIGTGMLAGLVALTVGFVLLTRWYPVACLIPVACAAAARLPIGFWARRRLERSAAEMEGPSRA